MHRNPEFTDDEIDAIAGSLTLIKQINEPGLGCYPRTVFMGRLRFSPALATALEKIDAAAAARQSDPNHFGEHF